MAESQVQALSEPLSAREREIVSLIENGLTNREIAQELYLSYETIKWYNKQIFGKLGVGRRAHAVARARQYGLLEDEPKSKWEINHRPDHNLPVRMTSFVGREAEVAQVTDLIKSNRILTLVGPGGTGKTRLAIESAYGLLAEFQSGALFVILAPINHPASVPTTIANAIGLKPTPGQPILDTIKEYLRHRNLLLILDNFEHLLEAAPVVTELISSAPDVKALITSREPLNVYGEQQFPVPPLTLPDPTHNRELATLGATEAVRLFVDRIRAMKPDFELTEENALPIAEITLRLDGLPLAIELAAARMKLFAPQMLLDQLDHRFQALGQGPRNLPDRQRTLEDTIAWSFDLLDESEQSLFSRLSVFQGSRTIDAIDAVCCSDLSLDVLGSLESLLNKNLIQEIDGPEGEPRFILLETIHEYARKKLDESGEAEEIMGKHAEYFTSLAERVAPEIRAGPTQMMWLHRLEEDHDNLRTALEWSFSGDSAQLGLRLVGALGYFWFRQGHYAEGKYWTSKAVDLVECAPLPVQAAVLHAAGLTGHYDHEPELGKKMHRHSLALYREIGDQREIGWTLIQLAVHSVGISDEYESAITLCEEGLDLLRGANDLGGAAQALNMIGELARLQGDTQRAMNAYIECLEIARSIGDRLREGIQLVNLAFLAHTDGDYLRTKDFILQCLQIHLEIEHLPFIFHFIAASALPLSGLGMFEPAARMIGASEAKMEKHGIIHQPSDQPVYDENKEIVREALGSMKFEVVYQQGRAMSLNEALDFAMELLDD